MKKNILSVILATIATIGMNINLNKNLSLIESFNGNEISVLIIFIVFIFFINKALENKDKRLNIVSVILGFIFGTFEVIGNSIVNYGNLEGILYSKVAFLQSSIKLMYYIIIISSVVKILMFYFDKIENTEELKKYKLFTNNKKSILVVFLVLMIAWLPYFLKYFPGIIGFDTLDQLKQALETKPMWNGSPICTTLTLKLIIDITMPIFNNLNISMAICTILKMMFTALIISYSIYYLAKKGINYKIRLLVLAFFAFNPVFSFYAISIDKDSLFASIFVMDFILLFEFITNKDNFIKSKFYMILSFIFVLLTALVRHNGMYIYVLLIPFLYITLRKKYLKLTAFIASTLLSVYLINTIAFAVFDVSQSSSFGLLCVPMQAMARLVKLNGDNLTEQEREEINLFVEYDELPASYNPSLADPEMGHFRKEYMTEHKLQYVILNIKLFAHYPNYYIESILCNTSGYWLPEKHKTLFDKGVIVNDFGIETKQLINNSLLDKLDKLTDNRQLTIVGMLFSAGLTLWVLMFLIFYIIYKRKYYLLVPLLPSIFNYIIVLMGPSNTEFRYIIPMYMPLSIMYCLIINRAKKDEDNKI